MPYAPKISLHLQAVGRAIPSVSPAKAGGREEKIRCRLRRADVGIRASAGLTVSGNRTPRWKYGTINGDCPCHGSAGLRAGLFSGAPGRNAGTLQRVLKDTSALSATVYYWPREPQTNIRVLHGGDNSIRSMV